MSNVSDAEWGDGGAVSTGGKRTGTAPYDRSSHSLQRYLNHSCNRLSVAYVAAMFTTPYDGCNIISPNGVTAMSWMIGWRLCDPWHGAEPTVAVTDSQSIKTAESGGPCGYDADKKIKGRKRHIAEGTEGFPITIHVHTADIQDRDGAPEVILDMLEGTPTVTKRVADDGYHVPKLRGVLKDRAVANLIEVVGKPKGIKVFTVLYQRWVVERSFAWLG